MESNSHSIPPFDGDLVIARGGRRHEIIISAGDYSPIDYSITDQNVVTHDSVTVHHNPNSEIGSITINRHRRVDDTNRPMQVAYVLDVRHGPRLAPIYVSVGQNLEKRDISPGALASAVEIELWPGQSVSSRKDSICYLLGVANRNVRFIIPEDFPRNVQVTFTDNFQVILFYWLFNQPIKFRATSLTPFAPDYHAPQQPMPGLELHQALNLTNDLTLEHLHRYPSFPDGA